MIWIPALAVSGMTFYTGDKFPRWKGDVFVGSLRTGEIPGTGHTDEKPGAVLRIEPAE
jgi:aldose sugar dehydrogenase